MIPPLSTQSCTALRLSLALAAVALISFYAEPAMACMGAGLCGPCPTPAPPVPFSKYIFYPSIAVVPMLALGTLAAVLSTKWRWYAVPAVAALASAWANCYIPPFQIFLSHCPVPEQPPSATALYTMIAIASFLITTFCFFARQKDITPTLRIHQFRPTHRLREVNID